MHKTDCKAEAARLAPTQASKQVETMEIPSPSAVPNEPGSLLDALSRYHQNAEMAESCCKRLATLAAEEAGAQALTAMGALKLLVSSAEKHSQPVAVLRWLIVALRNLCAADDVAGSERKVRAVQAGAFKLVVVSMQAYPQDVELQEHGCGALRNLCLGMDEGGVIDRRQRAGDADCLEAVLEAAQLDAGESLRIQVRVRR